MGNDELVELVKNDKFYLKFKSPRDQKVLRAMRKVDRKDFLVGSEKEYAYQNTPLSIGYGQTCSEPAMVGFMGDVLELREGMKVLEIGSGCGYHAAVVSHLIGNSGYLVTIEYIEELAELAQKNLKAHFGMRLEKRLRVVHGDGSIGFAEEAPFDRIYLTAGVYLNSFDPSILTAQLKPEGILLFSERGGTLIKQQYKNGQMVGEPEKYDGRVFVPLQGKNS